MPPSEEPPSVSENLAEEERVEEEIATELAATSLSDNELKIAAADEKRQQAALACLSSFRSLVKCQISRPEAIEFASDDTLLRYLRARDGNEEKALALFMSTLAWRHKNIVPISAGDEAPHGRCEQCKKDPRSHCFFNVGNDSLGRPVVYSCASRAANKVVDDNMLHMATTAIPMFADHYPERMGQIVLINPPAIFHMFWKAVKPILDPVTKEKIVMLRGPKAIAEYAAKHWQQDAAMAQWLDETMTKCKGAPGSFPDARVSDALGDAHTRSMLERCRQL